MSLNDINLEAEINGNFKRPKVDNSAFSLRLHQDELLQLAELAGIKANPTVMRIIIELLNMQIHPNAIFKMLKILSKTSKHKRNT